MEAVGFFSGVLSLAVLAVLAYRFGADSRPAFNDTRHNWW